MVLDALDGHVDERTTVFHRDGNLLYFGLGGITEVAVSDTIFVLAEVLEQRLCRHLLLAGRRLVVRIFAQVLIPFVATVEDQPLNVKLLMVFQRATVYVDGLILPL